MWNRVNDDIANLSFDKGDDSQASFSIRESAKFTDKYNFSIFFSGGIRGGDIPDPIPNSEVKPSFADGTTLKSVGE